LPGVYRFHERKAPDPDREEQRISLFLPQGVIDAAAGLAAAEGSTVQDYCERLIMRGVEAERARARLEEEETRRGALEGLRAIAEDADYLAEWQAAAEPRGKRFVAESLDAGPPGPGAPSITWVDAPGTSSAEQDQQDPLPAVPMSDETEIEAAVEVVMRHAGLSAEEDATGLLPLLRRGEGIGPAAARQLLLALEELETALEGRAALDRRLAYALHRLAFEGQVLLTDGWPARSADSATVDVLRLVQEGVDRVLSGEDIRYFPRDGGSEFTP
jgi:hypothetical protein